MKENTLAIIVPCYNEEEILEETTGKLLEIMNILKSGQKVDSKSYILLVDDGSIDNTWNIIKKLNKENKCVLGLRFDMNSGQHFVIRKGIERVLDKADVFITIDADLQDDPYAIIDMIEAYSQGNEIVFGVRNNRDSDTPLYKFCANLYYKVLNWLDVKSVSGHSEFRLMSKKVAQKICQYKHKSLYIRGLCAQMNVKSTNVYYARRLREKGQSKYSYKSLLDTGFDGITTAGARPLMMILYAGAISLLLGTIILLIDVLSGYEIMYGLLFTLFGINLLALSAIGQYVGRILIEVQNRPENKEIEFLDNKSRK